MFKVNVDVVKKMNKEEMFDAEMMYLTLAAYCHNEEFASGSREMRISPERMVIPSYTFSERQLLSSYKELFTISASVYKRTGERLLGFVSKGERTPDNALTAWWKLYRSICDFKKSKA